MWLGSLPNIVITDPDLGRRVLSKFIRRADLADGLAVFFGEDRLSWRSGLLFSHGPKVSQDIIYQDDTKRAFVL